MPWWNIEEWNHLLPNGVQGHPIEFVGGPFDGRWASRKRLEPLINLPVSSAKIEGKEFEEGSPNTAITSIANYVLSSFEGRWVYRFASCQHPKSLPKYD